MSEKFFIYRYKDKGKRVGTSRNTSLKWTFLSIIIFFIILALVPIFKKKKRVEKAKVLYEVPGKNVLIKKVPLPETMRALPKAGKNLGKPAKFPSEASRKEKLDELYKKQESKNVEKPSTVKSKSVSPKRSAAEKSALPAKSVELKSPSRAMPAHEVNKETVYIVQVGAFKNEKNALKLMSRLKKKGFKVFLSPEKHGELGLMYHVSLDPIKSRAKAVKLKEKLLKEEGIGGTYIKTETR